METRQLQYFLDVANCLNFTKAAQQNHIAQTAMSQNIISLENQLGFKLFVRNNRNVRLTHMGAAFYQEALEIIKTVHRSEAKMARINAGIEGVVRIGFQGEHESSFLPKLVREFRSQYPQVSVVLLLGICGYLEKMLNENEVDVIFTIQYQSSLADSLELLIEVQPLCVFTPIDHPFAAMDRIPRSSLSGEPMVFLDPSCGESIYNYMLHDSLNSGFNPRIVGHAESIYALVLMVECGFGITVLPKSCWKQQDVACVDMVNENPLNIVARWKPDSENPSLPLFVNLMRGMYRCNCENRKTAVT